MRNTDFSRIIKRSWEVTWKNKWLWVMGLVLAAFGGESGYNWGSSSIPHTNNTIPLSSPAPVNFQNIKDQTSNVLGIATDVIKNWFYAIPLHFWILFSLGILFLLLFLIIIRWVLTSWANGALIFGFEDADTDRKVNLITMTPQGISKTKDLIVLGFISFGMISLVGLGYIVVMALGFLVKIASPTLGLIWLILFGIVGFLILIVLMVIFSMIRVYSDRLIVLKNYKPWNAWKIGFNLAKGNFLPTVVMGIINSAIGCFVGCAGILIQLIIFAVPGYLLISPMFINGFRWPNIGQVTGIIILFILFGSVNLLIRAVLTVFNCGNWNQFFKQILENEKEINDKE